MNHFQSLVVPGVVALIALILAGPAAAQFTTSNSAGTAGAACSTNGQYAWPDSNGQILKCTGSNWAVTIGTTTAASQWTTSGSNIYYSGGNVGIGTNNPGAAFTVGNNAFEVNSSGTVLAGTWNGTTIAVANGGTGVGTFTANGVLYGNTTSAIGVTAQGGANTVLIANAGAPSFSASPTLGGVITDTQSIAATSTDGLVLTDPTAATSNNQKWSPRIHWTGQGWKNASGGASQSVDIIEELQPVQGGANPTGNLVISQSVNGGAYGVLLTLPTGGGLNLNSGTYQIGGTQIACANLSNGAASCSTDTTNASNISSGTLAIARGGTGSGTAAAYSLFGNNTSSVAAPAYQTAPILSGAIETLQAIAATSTDGIVLADTTAATNNNQKWSPRVHWAAQGWKTDATAGSQSVDIIAELQPVQGAANPSGNLVFSQSVAGSAYGALMTLTTGGNVGIGTTAPANLLDINGAASIGYVNTAAPSSGLIVSGNVGIGTTAPANLLDINGAASIGYVNTAAPSNGLIVSGNVGIGTTSPDSALHVRSGITFSTDTTAIPTKFGATAASSSSGVGLGAYSGGYGAIQGLNFNATTGTYVLINPMGGPVGIGGSPGTSPVNPLSVSGRTSIGTSYWATTAPTNGLIVQGNVGIGTTSPQATLDVNGYARLKLNSSQPAACSGTNQGAFALNHLAQACACNGSSWIFADSVGGACAW